MCNENAEEAPDLATIARRVAQQLTAAHRLPRGVEREDIEQEAVVGALESASSYDASKGASATTWAERCARWKALRMLGRERRHERHEREPQPIAGDDAETCPPGGCVEVRHGAAVSPSSLQEATSVRRRAAEAALATASPAVEAAVRRYAAGGVTWEQAAREAGVSVSAVHAWRQGVGDGVREGGRSEGESQPPLTQIPTRLSLTQRKQ